MLGGFVDNCTVSDLDHPNRTEMAYSMVMRCFARQWSESVYRVHCAPGCLKGIEARLDIYLPSLLAGRELGEEADWSNPAERYSEVPPVLVA